MITTVSYSQNDILKSILALHTNGRIDLDPTYSKGNFYKNGIPEPKYRFDIEPKFPYVGEACATSIPLPDNSVSTIVFDPPFLATTGPSLKKKSGNIINKRFGVFPNEKLLHEFYIQSLKEFYRLSEKNGVLIFKCQDKVSSGKQYFSHCFIYEQAREIGWYPKDLFILMAKNRVVADWQRNNQIHARKFHSYFWVFEKRKRNICI